MDTGGEAGEVLRDVTARGVRLRVLEAGDAAAPALVLVHDFFVSHREFDDIIGPFSDSHHVIAPDLPGFGESEKPNPARYPYGLEASAEAIADLIAAFGVGRVSLIGHGMGAAIALLLAAQHPELVQRLVVVGAHCYPHASSWRIRASLAPIVGGIFFKQLFGRSLFRGYFRDEVFGPNGAMPLARVDKHYDLFNSPAARESAYAVLSSILDTRGVVARVTRITAPTFVVWGRDDRIVPATHAQRLAREIARAKLEIMDAGHSPHEEHPARFVEIVTHFLEGRRG